MPFQLTSSLPLSHPRFQLEITLIPFDTACVGDPFIQHLGHLIHQLEKGLEEKVKLTILLVPVDQAPVMGETGNTLAQFSPDWSYWEEQTLLQLLLARSLGWQLVTGMLWRGISHL